MGGTSEQPVSHMVQLLVLPVSAVDCNKFASCERLKLQSTESFLSRGDASWTSLKEDFVAAPLRYCQIGEPHVLIRIFVSPGALLDAPADLPTLQQTIKVGCRPCKAGWKRQETSDGLWTCVRCDKKQYIIDPNTHQCRACPGGARCEFGGFTPVNPSDSVWNSTSDGVYRITKCPAGFVLIRDENEPVLDRCVACAADTYSVEEAVFGEKLWDRSVENYNQYCHPCPRARAMCSGANDLRPLAGAPFPLLCCCAPVSRSRSAHVCYRLVGLQKTAPYSFLYENCRLTRSSFCRLLVAPQQHEGHKHSKATPAVCN